MTSARRFYHSFEMLGLGARQKGGIYPINQQCKEAYILGYLLLALAKARRHRVRRRPSVLELFCADGYYATLAKRFGAGKVVGIDRDQGAIADAISIRDALGLAIEYRVRDVLKYGLRERFDIVLCTGGLYHLAKPCRFLENIRKLVKRYIVLQSVVSLRSDDPEYFVSPAPGWKHGCRFSLGYFERMIQASGYHILDLSFNHLEGNRRMSDRGSAYALCSTRAES